MINLEHHFIDCLVVVTLSSVSGVKLTVIAPARTQIVARLLWFCQRFSFMGSEWPVIMLSPRWIHAQVYAGVDMSGPWAPVHVSLLVLHPSVLWMFLQVMGLYQLTLLFTPLLLPFLMAFKLALTEGTLQALELEFTLQTMDLYLGLGLHLDHHI